MVEEEVAARAIMTMRMMIVPITVLENYLLPFPTQPRLFVKKVFAGIIF
jgi:hypothetical protein